MMWRMSGMNPPRIGPVAACVFDAYGTLFDVGTISPAVRDELPGHWQALAQLWRAKQLQYTWLRGLAGHHADFWQVTGDALDYAMENLGLGGADLRERLLNQYLHISVYSEVEQTLAQLKSQGVRLAVLSNGTPAMLATALATGGIAAYFDAVISVEEVGVFKPHPSVYALAPQRLGVPKECTCFVSSNGWDACSAKAFGFRVLWCNRSAQPAERIPLAPDGEVRDLSQLPSCLAA